QFNRPATRPPLMFLQLQHRVQAPAIDNCGASSVLTGRGSFDHDRLIGQPLNPLDRQIRSSAKIWYVPGASRITLPGVAFSTACLISSREDTSTPKGGPLRGAAFPGSTAIRHSPKAIPITIPSGPARCSIQQPPFF